MWNKTKSRWYRRKDKTQVYKEGKYKVLEITKTANQEYKWVVFDKGEPVEEGGIRGKKYFAVRLGILKARELKIIQ